MQEMFLERHTRPMKFLRTTATAKGISETSRSNAVVMRTETASITPKSCIGSGRISVRLKG